MTVNSTSSSITVEGTGAQTVFSFPFIGVAPAYIQAVYTTAGGTQTALTQGPGSSQFQVSLNAPVPGATWGLGGTVTYNPSGSPIPDGSTLTISRQLPLTQPSSLSNQGNLSSLASASESIDDLTMMKLQQVEQQAAYAIQANPANLSPPLPLPPAAQAAGQALVFDSTGNNLVAGAAPASGIISSAMQPVVNSASLAAGRAAFGLGALAVEGIGAGLGDDGAGSARVNQTVTVDGTNQTVDNTFAWALRVASTAITYTLDSGASLWNGFTFQVDAAGGAVTLAIQSNDRFYGQASGASYSVPTGYVATVSCDGTTNSVWYVRLAPTKNTNASAAYLQNKFSLATSTSVQLLPKGGDLVTIAGVSYAIPSGGVSSTITNCSVNGVAAQTLSNSTLYYAYLYNNAGTLTIDFSTTGHVTDVTAGNIGVEIKSGDNSRTLIGMVYPLTGPVLQTLLVLSWANKAELSSTAHFTTARSTSSATYVEINSEIRVPFLVWSGDSAITAINGAVGGGGPCNVATAIAFNGATPDDAFTECILYSNTYLAPANVSFLRSGLTEGYNYATLVGLSSSGSVSWSGGNTAGSRTTLTVGVRG